jgi:alginate O-acetyltransferase complex protein AlgJ
MVLRYQRYWAVLALLCLASPLAFGMMRPDGPDFIYFKEGRRPAPVPSAPHGLADLSALPRQIDAYLSDSFGLRRAMINLHKDLSHPVILKVNTAALIGRDGRIFFQDHDMVRQSAGLLYRTERVAEAVDLVVAMRDALAKRGARLLVTIPPNPSTIFQDDLPVWAQTKGRKTEHDLFFEELAARGVKTVDLRPVMRAIEPQADGYYRYDSHWTPKGALAAFNAVVEADGHPDWRIDPAVAIGGPQTIKGGDVARVLGVQDEVSESVAPFALKPYGEEESLQVDAVQLPGMPDHVLNTGRPGPTVLVLGDSFTALTFPLLLSQHVGRAAWINRRLCGFDWKVVDRLEPDEVWWAPTERLLLCDPGFHPVDFTGPSAANTTPAHGS